MPLSNNYLIDNFPGTSTVNWTPRQGGWTVANGEYRSHSTIAITQARDFSANDLVLDCEIRLGATGDGGITVRSSNGENGYFISFRPQQNAIWVFDLANNNPTLEANNAAGIVANQWRRVRIIVRSNRLLVYYDDMQLPRINMVNIRSRGAGAGLFLRSWQNETAYRAVRLYELNDFYEETFDQLLLTKWIPYRGNHFINNERISITGNELQIAIANTGDMSDFVIEADMRIDGDRDCGFMIRSDNAWNQDGYYVGFNAQHRECYIWELNGGNGVANRLVTGLNIPRNVFHHVKIICYKEDILVYLNDMLTPIITAYSTTRQSGRIGIRSINTACQFDNFSIKRFEPEHVVNVRVLNFNPIFSQSASIPAARGKSLVKYYERNDPKRLAYQYVSSILEDTDYQVYYRVRIHYSAFWTEINGFPPFVRRGTVDPFIMDENTWLSYFPYRGAEPGIPDDRRIRFNNRQIIDAYGIISQIHNNTIDEVWTFFDGASHAFYESYMVGSNPYYINGTQIPEPVRNFVVMGFDYGRPYDLMLHSFTHRIEFMMSAYYGRNIYLDSWNPNNIMLTYNQLNNLEKFLLPAYRVGERVQNNSQVILGVGEPHWPPNQLEIPLGSNYNYSRENSISSNFAYWKNYGKQGYNITDTDHINVTTWRCFTTGWGEGDHEGYMRHWFKCLPKAVGIIDESNIEMDWWKYITDPHLPRLASGPFIVSGHEPTPELIYKPDSIPPYVPISSMPFVPSEPPFEETETSPIAYEKPPMDETETSSIGYEQPPLDKTETSPTVYEQPPMEETETSPIGYEQPPLDETATSPTAYEQPSLDETETSPTACEQPPLDETETSSTAYEQPPFEEETDTL